MEILIIGGVLIALLAVVAIGVTLRQSDTQGAIGELSSETIRKDRPVELTEEAEEAEPAMSGAAVEAAARSAHRGELVAASTAPPVAYVPPDPETLGVTRRQFLNRGIITMFGLGLSSFGAACIAFLWPSGSSGFGSKINVGKIPDIQAGIVAGNGFLYVPEGRMWVTEFPAAAVEKASTQYAFYSQVQGGLEAGVTALFQTCPHLGCRVPECQTSQWFECPCHGSQYNRVGEKKGGPAPRGMDRFPMSVNAAGDLIVDTGTVIQGPPIGVNTTGQEAEGPNCLSAGEGH